MRIQTIVFLALASMILSCATASRAQITVTVGAGDRFGELDEYGDWIEVEGYGRCWHPYADAGWRPFLYGRWVYSDEGWVWDSDEPFGWIVCHYGNWFNDPDLGWVWVPGYDWSPAPVRWYVTDNEIGWAPLFPNPRPGFHRRHALAEWSFCPVQSFTGGGEIRDHVSFRDRPGQTGVSVHVYSGPPRKEFVQRIARAPVATVNLSKARVTTNAGPLVKMEVPGRQRQHMEAPVGPRFKKPLGGKPVIVPHEKEPAPLLHGEQPENSRERPEEHERRPERGDRENNGEREMQERQKEKDGEHE